MQQERDEPNDDAALTSLLPHVLAAPAKPTTAEYQAHQLTHLPFAAWCPFCVSARANENPHKRVRRQTDESVAVPRIEADFMIVDPERVVLTAVDTSTSYTHAALLPLGKVSSDQYSLRPFASFLKMLP